MYWALLDVVLDYMDQASKTVKRNLEGLIRASESGDNGALAKIAGIIVVIILLFYKLLKSLFDWSSSKSQRSASKYPGTSIQSHGGISVGERITGQDIFNAAVGGKAVITSHWGADRSWNRSAKQRAAGNTKHKGVDIKAVYGTQLYAPFDGVIENVNRSNAGTGGRSLHIIDHENGIDVLYLHLSEIQVESGQKVTKGEPIAKSGASGHGQDHKYAPHLHLQIRKVGRDYEDPEKFVVESKSVVEYMQFASPGIETVDWDGSAPDYSKLPKPETMEKATQTRENQLAMAKQAWELAKLVGKKLGVSPEIIWSQFAQETGYFAVSRYHGDYNFGHMESARSVARTGGLYMGKIPVKPGIKDVKQAGHWFYNFETAEGAAEAFKMMVENNKWDVKGVTSGVEYNRRIQSKEFNGTGYNYHKAVGDSIGRDYEAIRKRFFKKSSSVQVNSVRTETSTRVTSKKGVETAESRANDETHGISQYDQALLKDKGVKNIFKSETISHVGVVFETNRRLQG